MVDTKPEQAPHDEGDAIANLRAQLADYVRRHQRQQADLKRALLVLADQKAESAQGVMTRSESVGDLNTFLFKELPYRNVVASNLTQGLVEVEDRHFTADQPINWQLPYWSFGSKYYRIDRAVRVHYMYAYPQPGEPPLQGSLFFGFQSNGKVPAPSNPNGTARLARALARPMLRESEIAVRVAGPNGSGHNQGFGNERLPTIDQLLDSLRTGTNPGINTTQFNNIIHDFDDFVVAMEPNGPGATPPTLSDWQRQFLPKRRFDFGDVVAYSGIAADNDQTQPFPYNLGELVAANKLDDLIAWHFGSTGFRVTKAIRLTYDYAWNPVLDNHKQSLVDDQGNPILTTGGTTSGTLLIGYTGPHPS
jgi:hypothetical protein